MLMYVLFMMDCFQCEIIIIVHDVRLPAMNSVLYFLFLFSFSHSSTLYCEMVRCVVRLCVATFASLTGTGGWVVDVSTSTLWTGVDALQTISSPKTSTD